MGRTPTDQVPLVSVVVPVFNADQHLVECLDSLLAQTLSPIEVIAVDDGSTDRSAALLLLAAASGRIRVITLHRNQGVSAARNAGLSAAKGTFVAFVDADDLVSPTMYEELYAAAEATDADIACCGIRVVDAAGKLVSREPFPMAPGTHAHPALREELHRAWAKRLLWYPSRSVYRRSLLVGNGVRFDEGIRKGEDSLFNLEALYLAERVVAVDKALYDYRKHASSATARPLASESDNLERLGSSVTGFYTAHEFDERAFDDFYGHVLRSDLPTAVVRLQRHESSVREIRALIDTDTVREAFRTQRVSQLVVPARVRAVLILCRYRAAGTLALMLRFSARVRPLRAA